MGLDRGPRRATATGTVPNATSTEKPRLKPAAAAPRSGSRLSDTVAGSMTVVLRQAASPDEGSPPRATVPPTCGFQRPARDIPDVVSVDRRHSAAALLGRRLFFPRIQGSCDFFEALAAFGTRRAKPSRRCGRHRGQWVLETRPGSGKGVGHGACWSRDSVRRTRWIPLFSGQWSARCKASGRPNLIHPLPIQRLPDLVEGFSTW